MNTFSKKLISVTLAVTTFVWLSGAFPLIPAAQAQTAAELQQRIEDLLRLITDLKAQLDKVSGGGTTTACTFTRSLTLGAQGEDVRCLQQYLNSAGFTLASSGAGSPGNETTTFGPLTRTAVSKWQAANGVSPAVGYFGPISQAKYSSVAGTTGGTTGGGTTGGGGTVPGTGLTLSLAADNPASTAVPKGATGVTFLKFRVSGSGTLDSLTFKRKGIGATADFSSAGFYIFDGTTRLTTGKSLNSTTHEVNFVNLNLAVSGSRTFSLVADVAGGSTTGNRNSFELVSATGNPTPTGSLIGGEMVIAGQSVGSVTSTSAAAPSNPKLGEVGAVLGEFKLAVGSTEDVLIQRIAVTEGGTINNDHLINLVLKQNDVVVARTASIGAKDLMTFNFDTPFLIEKGQEKNFKVYGDVGGLARANDTVVLYFDSASDINAVGKTYGYPVTVDITSLDTTGEGDTLTVQGGDVTITFNGPIAGDIALRGQDVTVFDITITSLSNIEIKNLRLNATTTGLASGEGFNDFKVWDTGSNAVISSATDVTTSSAVTVTDIININAGQSKRMKVTVDVDPDNDNGDDITVSLQTFQANDIRNLDNNTFVASSTIIPNAVLAGNVQDTLTPGLDLQLSASPGSQSSVKGSVDLPLSGFSFRATGDDVKITSLKVNASSSATGTVSTIISDLLNVALYDGATRISDIKSFQNVSSLGEITFSNMNFVIPKGQTKVLTTRGNISTAATNATYFVYIAAATSSNITAIDTQGNSVSITGVGANSGNTVNLAVLSTGDVSVVKNPDDGESKPGVVIAGTESVLGKFKFTSQNEAMTVKKLIFQVSETSTQAVTSTAATDEVISLKLFDSSGQVGATAGYPVTGSGDNAGLVVIEDLNWLIGKNQDRVLTVKGVLGSIDTNSANAADAGSRIYVHVATTTYTSPVVTFEAQGATGKDTSISTATSSEKLIYRTMPTIERLDLPSGVFTTNPAIAKFRVRAGSQADVSFKVFQFKVSMASASLTAPTTSNVTVNEMRFAPSTNISIATLVSGLGTGSTGANAIAGTNTFFFTVYLSAEETVAAGDFKDYQVRATFNGISGTVGASTLDTLLNVAETATVTSTQSYATVVGVGNSGNPSFVWSDNSKISHSESTADWTNGVRIDMPTATWFLKN